MRVFTYASCLCIHNTTRPSFLSFLTNHLQTRTHTHKSKQDPSLPPLALSAARPLLEANPKLGLSVFTDDHSSTTSSSKPASPKPVGATAAVDATAASSPVSPAGEGAAVVGGRGVTHQEVLAALKVRE